jgi:hypothetical protein
VAGTVWPDYKIEWDLPEGVSQEQVLAQHSAKNLLERLRETLPLQVWEHRGMYSWGAGIQECTLGSMITALGPVGQRNLSEFDAALTKDLQPAPFHEFNTWRVTELPDRLIRDMASSEVEGARIIIREVGPDGHTERYRRTEDTVVLTETALDKIFAINPEATIFLDAREFEAHLIVAWLSHRPRYHNRIVVLLYSFKYFDGDHFVEWVEKAEPAANWRETVAMTPVVFPEELPKMARFFGLGTTKEYDLFDGGKAWLNSFFKHTARWVAAQVMMSMVTEEQLEGSTDPEVIQAFTEQFAATRLGHYVKNDPDLREKLPYLKLSTGTRSYVYSSLKNDERRYWGINFLTGRDREWETDPRKHIRYGYATPGKAAALADWIISDRSEDDMAIQQWRMRNIEPKVDFRCPHLDAYSNVIET